MKICKMCEKCIERNMLDFDVLYCIQKPMACVTSSIDLLYLIKTSQCRWIILMKENVILFIWLFCFNIRLNNCYIYEKDLQFYWLLIYIPMNIYTYEYIYIYICIYDYQVVLATMMGNECFMITIIYIYITYMYVYYIYIYVYIYIYIYI